MPDLKSSATFSNRLRSIQYGYRLWRGMYVRITKDMYSSQFFVEMVPQDRCIKYYEVPFDYIRWWDDSPDLLESSPGIVARAAQGQRCSFFIGDDGEEVRS